MRKKRDLTALQREQQQAGVEMLDQYQYLGNCPPTPPPTQQ